MEHAGVRPEVISGEANRDACDEVEERLAVE